MNDQNKILQQILEILSKKETKVLNEELVSETNGLIEKAEKQAEEASIKIQSHFDRIHDKLFTINGILIASFFGLGKFPIDNPIINLWLVILPITNLFYLIFLEQQQMEIYRHLSQRMNWEFKRDNAKYGKMVNRQNLKSLLAILVTLALFLYLAIKIIIF